MNEKHGRMGGSSSWLVVVSPAALVVSFPKVSPGAEREGHPSFGSYFFGQVGTQKSKPALSPPVASLTGTGILPK